MGRYGRTGGHRILSITVVADSWLSKPFGETYEFPTLQSDMSGIGHAFSSDESISILDLKFQGHNHDGELPFNGQADPRRMSGSSFTTGAMSDMTSYEDFSTTMSETPSFVSDYPLPSKRNSYISSTQLSPVASPRMTPQSRSELVRTASRGRASPSPRPGKRSAPYSVEAVKSKRWSTGSYATTPNRRTSPFIYSPHQDAYGIHSRKNYHAITTSAATRYKNHSVQSVADRPNSPAQSLLQPDRPTAASAAAQHASAFAAAVAYPLPARVP